VLPSLSPPTAERRGRTVHQKESNRAGEANKCPVFLCSAPLSPLSLLVSSPSSASLALPSKSLPQKLIASTTTAFSPQFSSPRRRALPRGRWIARRRRRSC